MCFIERMNRGGYDEYRSITSEIVSFHFSVEEKNLFEEFVQSTFDYSLNVTANTRNCCSKYLYCQIYQSNAHRT